MRLVAAFAGSRGDVQPGLALSLELTRRGHDVTMAVPPNLVDFAESAGVQAVPYGTDTAELLGSATVTDELRSRDPVRRLRAVRAVTRAGALQATQDLRDACDGADLLVGGSVGQERALAVAEARGIGYLPVHLCPLRPNRRVGVVAPRDRELPGWATAATWHLLEQALWTTSRRDENSVRAALGLRPARTPAGRRIDARGLPAVQAYDPVLFPGLARDWGAGRPMVGFLAVPPDTGRSLTQGTDIADLATWLRAGPPPVYVGFGSMSVADPPAVRSAVLAATRGHRVLIASGWGGMFSGVDRDVDADDRVRVVDSVDHAAVLPLCAAAVHHGGAGTTAATLRAGVPAVVCWLGADQPLWGRAVSRAGVGTALRLPSITPDGLGGALARVLTAGMRARAETVAAEMVTPAEAVTAAAEVVESAVAPPHRVTNPTSGAARRAERIAGT
ncbi:glycosyltransferase [Williamsia deligens]|uniref:Glycosyltransferase n=1 Tax=Williamsia deligens TaxID=321325 RepID=A0ABW3G9Y0_9NOCA|nr:nucleotide disphospho-sugar-binding domain-containing protein [Williamsia deligens]MCP2196181.1 UDP:flavonoid glycosyltransferase YjiC, YdhE family [Williamsia deligens]